MRSLRDLLREAQENGAAIGHFNVSDLVLLKAVFTACPGTPRARHSWFVRGRA
jgi:fructose/tagatose bisphosphate aldolase